MGAGNTLSGGLLGLIAAGGIGLGVVRLVGPIPPRWRLAISLVSGVALTALAVLRVLFVGGGATGVKWAGAGAAVAGCVLLWVLRKDLAFAPGIRPARRADWWFIAVIVAVAGINLLIAVAPSSKIDELYYHMLIPKRVSEDGGVYLYRSPLEAAIFPQVSFQLGLSAAHATGFPEAGNVISWGLGVALTLLVAGVTADLTGSATAGWATGAISAVGLYPSVWHVTSGPHALGDLATVTAVLLALLPDGVTGQVKPQTRLLLVSVAAYVAASTKISLLPLSMAATLIGVRRAAVHVGWKKAMGIAGGVWVAFYGPIILWTTLRCGSPLGLATASMFHSSYFGPDILSSFKDFMQEPKGGWTPFLLWLAPSVSAGVVAAFGLIAWAAWRRGRIFKVVAGLVGGQALLIVWLLPHDFRFLGGLQYVVLIMGAWVFWPSKLGMRAINQGWLVLLVLCLPWLAVETRYAAPFAKVDFGIMSRRSFLREYVAFTDDFRALDRLLPSNAVLYVVNSRLPSYYAPRPVIFTLEDLRERKPLYRFTVGADAPPVEDPLSCAETVYVNSSALSVVYRTPGRPGLREPLKVERCDLLPSRPR
jgi:hypothetical protein